ncbi:MAG TPA: hypothetical protein VFW07_22335 [Parafilimonas sp.]|nr:hypothetical protein [Parafilimonas sp.]
MAILSSERYSLADLTGYDLLHILKDAKPLSGFQFNISYVTNKKQARYKSLLKDFDD